MPEPEVARTSPMPFQGVNPILRVGNVAASVEYYVQKLGFKVDWGDSLFTSVSRGRCAIFLCEGDQGHPGSWVWIGVEDVDVLVNELSERGAKIRQGPTNFSWACEIQVEDLDGNVLRLGSDPKEGVPYGPWLDMNGVKWVSTGEGGWKRE